ncbi:N-acetylmuramoyl-L-alanine amidase [Mycobacterium gordonae]|nr:N-acetylmuramoyl-L-alanine amidase [Mycobacterium gordonae]
MPLVVLDDGHGLETAGKRTPVLPDGTVMRENEFNRRVVQLLAANLMRCGFDVLLVAPGDNDVPLRVRTDTANKAKADLYVSVHANAAGKGGFNAARGLETFYFKGSVASERAARMLHKRLLSGSVLPDRGVKTADFHVLRETNMPSVLVECAFMTNLQEALLLVSEDYRVECADELARGICDYFNKSFVPKGGGIVVDNNEKMSQEDAEKVIRFLSAGYMAITPKDGRDEFRRLANEVRKAAGMPTQ